MRRDHGHHSLVTPIDWKLTSVRRLAKTGLGHHSLVTPIDWKQPIGSLNVALETESPLAGDTY